MIKLKVLNQIDEHKLSNNPTKVIAASNISR